MKHGRVVLVREKERGVPLVRRTGQRETVSVVCLRQLYSTCWPKVAKLYCGALCCNKIQHRAPQKENQRVSPQKSLGRPTENVGPSKFLCGAFWAFLWGTLWFSVGTTKRFSVGHFKLFCAALYDFLWGHCMLYCGGTLGFSVGHSMLFCGTLYDFLWGTL